MGLIAGASIEHGWRVPSVKWIMLSSPFAVGVGFYVFYALQPYLLELSGHPEAYGIAGLVAAIVAGADIAGGLRRPGSAGCSGAGPPRCSPRRPRGSSRWRSWARSSTSGWCSG